MMKKRKRQTLSGNNIADELQQPWPRENKLLAELRKQKSSGILCDVVFVYEDFKLYSHACVLAAFSPYMMKLFLFDQCDVLMEYSDWCIKMPLKINLHDILQQSSYICCECFTCVIDFMYTSKIHMYNCHLSHIEYAATMLQINELINVCHKYKESVQTKPRFSADNNSGSVLSSDNKSTKCIALDCAVNCKNAINSQIHEPVSIKKYLKTSDSDDKPERQNSEKINAVSFKSAQISCEYAIEMRPEKQQTDNLNSVFDLIPADNTRAFISPENKEHFKVQQYSVNNYFPSKYEPSRILFNEEIVFKQDNCDVNSKNITNVMSKNEFMALIGLMESEKSVLNVLKFSSTKNEELPASLHQNQKIKITDEGNISVMALQSVQNQSSVNCEEDVLKNFCSSGNTKENVSTPLNCILDIQSVEMLNTKKLCTDTTVETMSANNEEVKNICNETAVVNITSSKNLGHSETLTHECQITEENVSIVGNNKTEKHANKTDIPLNKIVCADDTEESINIIENNNDTEENANKTNVTANRKFCASETTILKSQLTDQITEENLNIVRNINKTEHANKNVEREELTKNNMKYNRNMSVANIKSSSCFKYHVENISTTKSVENMEYNTVGNKDSTGCQSNVFGNVEGNKSTVQVETGVYNKTCVKTKFCCDICQYKTLRLSKMVGHLEKHDHNQTRCSICTYEFKTNVEFKRHLKLHKEKLPFLCLTCNKRCKSITYFKNHLLIHSSKKSFICNICNALFKHLYNLQRHKAREHLENSEKVYNCEHCEYTTSAKHKLIVHLQEHGFTLPVFKCLVNNCSFKATRKFSLTRHEKTHVKTERFICDVCGYTFHHEKNLKRHVEEKHNAGILKLQCPVCNFITNRKHTFDTHMAGHTKLAYKRKSKKEELYIEHITDNNPSPYKCEICEEQFVNNANVRRHKMTVHRSGIIKIKCGTCGYTTTRRDLYMRHFKKHLSTSTENECYKQRKLACKTSEPVVTLSETVSDIKNLSEGPLINFGEMLKSGECNMSVDKTFFDINNSSNKLMAPVHYTGENTLQAEEAGSSKEVIDVCSKLCVCEICGVMLVSEENLQIHKSEEHIEQDTYHCQYMGRGDNSICSKSKTQFETEELNKNNQCSGVIGVLIPLSESQVTNLSSNLTACLDNEQDVLTHQNSCEQNVVHESQFDSNSHTLPVVDSVKEVYLNEQTGQLYTQNESSDSLQITFANSERVCCNLESTEVQRQPSSVTSVRTIMLNETGDLNVIDTCGTSKDAVQQNYSVDDKHIYSDIPYPMSLSNNTVETSVNNNLCNTISDGSCDVIRNCSVNSEHDNAENMKVSTEHNIRDAFSSHSVSKLNRTFILNETTGEINMIIDSNSNSTGECEGNSRWQTTEPSASAWILDESTGTLTNVNLCNEQLGESSAINEQSELITFPNQNTTVILNEGTGELTFSNLNSENQYSVEQGDNSDVYGNNPYFDDDTQSNFSGYSLEDLTFDNISLPSPSDGNERNSVTEFLNELTGEINLSGFTADQSSNNSVVNDTNYINCNFKEPNTRKNGGEISWNQPNNEVGDLIFLNELTGEILKSNCKRNNSVSSGSMSMLNNSLPNVEGKNNINGRNEILNETTGELSVHLDDELTKESADSVYLNEETGVISWNTLNQGTSESNFLSRNSDWFFENLPNDSLDSFTPDDDDFSKHFQYNLLLNSSSEDLMPDTGTSDTLLNESTGELVRKTCSESQ